MTEDEARIALLMGVGGIRLDVQKGHEVVVVRGQKVPKGTRGIVRWMGDSDFGPRLGIVVPGDNKLTYTYLKNVEIVYPGFNPGEQPVEGWIRLSQRNNPSNRHVPRKGHTVKHRETGVTGNVFWVDGDRLGFKAPHTVWADASEVDRVWSDSRTGSPRSESYDTSCPHAIPLRPSHVWEKALAHLPAPFCDIRSFERVENGYRAMGADGKVVCTMPDASVPQLLAGR